MYTDEQILQIRKQMEQERKLKEKQENLEEELEQSIFDGTVKILGRDVIFARRDIEDFGISIVMPQEFEMLDKEVSSLIYPSAEGPKHVFTSEEGYMSVSFKLNNNPVPKDQLMKFVELSKAFLEQSGARVKIVKTYEAVQEDINIGVIEYISKVMDGVAYTCMGFLPVKNGVLLICILFKNSQKKRFCTIAKEIFESIQYVE